MEPEAEKIVKFLADSLEQGKDFVLSQAPDVVRELVAWERLYNFSVAAVALCAAIALAFLSLSLYRKAKSADEADKVDLLGGVLLVCLCVAVVAACLSIAYFYNGLQWAVAPKYSVLQWCLQYLR